MHRRQFLKAAAATAAGGTLTAAGTPATAGAMPKISAARSATPAILTTSLRTRDRLQAQTTEV